MAPRLFLKTSAPPTPATEQPPSQTPSTASARPKIKLTASQPATPAHEHPGTVGLNISKSGSTSTKKRPADNDLSTPALKRVASNAATGRKASVVLKLPSARTPTTADSETPVSAGARIKLQRRQSTAPRLKRLNVKGRIPDRAPGNAYDSEDSERELDPATEQHLVLRMQPGEDCNLLRKAIADRTIGLSVQEGGLDVSFKFLDRDLRRVLVTVRKNMYAAVLVDLPCIVETMKSWDKRGWWKVTDISQMLLVLGRVSKEEEAKSFALPARVINEKTMAYAHGLTPPMHWVRKRRFRKRLTYKDNANIEDEVNKLLEEDERVEREGGETEFQILNRESLERSIEPENFRYEDEDAAIDTIENQAGYDDDEEQDYAKSEEMDLDAAEADLQALFDQDAAAAAAAAASTPANALPDQAASMVIMDAGSDTPASGSAPPETPMAQEDDLFGDQDESSDEDDDDDDVDAYDEDALAKAAERNLQQQEVEDLENEIKLQRQKLDATKNQLLRQRQREKLNSLEEDLRMKRRVFGYVDDDEED